MNIEYGFVKNYSIKQGFGFVTKTFDNRLQESQDVYFHITSIKCDFPDLARQLDDGAGKNVYFWYLIDTSEREKVEKIWLDFNSLPERHQEKLVSYIEKLLNCLPSLLTQINTDLIKKYCIEETPINNPSIQKEDDNLSSSQIETKQKKFKKSSEEFYAGLPEDLVNSVFWVAREHRTHPYSHVPGGYDVIFEFCNSKILEYDWIKSPSAYVKKIICDAVGCKLNELNYLEPKIIMNVLKNKFNRIFIRQYRDNGSPKRFHEVWNLDTSNIVPFFITLRPNEMEVYIDTEEELLSFLASAKKNVPSS